MLQFIKSRRFRNFLIVICALLKGAVVAIATNSSASPVTSVIGTVFSPFQKAAAFVAEKIDWLDARFESSSVYIREIERLEYKIAEYENQLIEYNDALHKLESYESMLGVKQENPDFEFEPAMIIGTDSADMFSSLILDKGSNDGISANDPVIYGNFVVGIVKKVHPSYCVVESLINPDVNISAIDSKTRETAYVTTTAEYALGGYCVMSGLSHTTAISPGGLILTSGIGGVYPKGLVIGTVTEVGESKYELSGYAVIKPGAEIRALEDVFVITDFEGQGVEEIID